MRARVDWRWIDWLPSRGVAAKKVSVSGQSVASMNEGMTDCHAVQGVLHVVAPRIPLPGHPCGV